MIKTKPKYYPLPAGDYKYVVACTNHNGFAQIVAGHDRPVFRSIALTIAKRLNEQVRNAPPPQETPME